MRKSRALIGVFVCLCVMFLCTGYAALTDHLSMSGEAEISPPDYDTIVITEVSVVNSDVNSESSSRVIPTNLYTSITADAGESVTYRIVAKNHSETESYIYSGVTYSTDFAAVGDKLTISASSDAAGTQPLSDSLDAAVISGAPILPGEEFVFYATYTANAEVNGDILVRYAFPSVAYTVTYIDDNEVFAVDCVVDNSKVYYVRDEGPTRAGQVFADWINAGAVAVDSYPAGNTNDYTLSAKWENLYLIIFVDEKGEVIYEETFTNSTKALSAEGQAFVSAKLSELAIRAAEDDMTVAWSEYNIATATSDIVVRPVYTYTGNLKFTPIDTDGDGITDYYRVDAVARLNDPTKIPGRFNGLDVEVINKLYLNENNFDYGAGVKTIEIGEGVKSLNHNALAYTEDLSTVKMPSTLEYIGDNAFSRNFGSDRKVLTIEFNGTMAEWQEIVNNSHEDWHNGLKTGSVVKCSDGYFRLDRGWTGLGAYKWTAYSY